MNGRTDTSLMAEQLQTDATISVMFAAAGAK